MSTAAALWASAWCRFGPDTVLNLVHTNAPWGAARPVNLAQKYILSRSNMSYVCIILQAVSLLLCTAAALLPPCLAALQLSAHAGFAADTSAAVHGCQQQMVHSLIIS